jgi:hypothetical protein
MPFSGDTFNLEMLDGRYVHGGQATSLPKVHDTRIATEFQGIATGPSTIAGRVTAVEAVSMLRRTRNILSGPATER